MKDLHTTPNENLEARITAWVFGEASPFEAAELEALCAADPELQLFLNRTKALHSLLLETQHSTTDRFWKLSPAKREKLDPIIGPNNSTPTKTNSRIRRAAFRSAFGIAAVFILTFFIGKFFVRPQMSKESPVLVSYSALPELRGMIIDAQEAEVSLEEKSFRSRQKSAVLSKRESEGKTSSAMSKVIAAASDREVSIPVPSVDVSKPSLDFADGKDFGGGWGGIGGNAVSGKNDGGIGHESFGTGGGGGTNRDISNTTRAVESSTATVDAFASNDSRQQGGFTYQSEKFKNATESATVPGILGEAAASTGTGTIAGLRSGDYAVHGESIDAILNNPNRPASGLNTIIPPAEGESQSSDLVFSDSDALRTNPAITSEHADKIDEVRRNLYMAEGNFDLGKYDDAKKAYEDTLRIDPYNQAARRGMEKVAATKSDYYRAAYDQTRSELLMEVDKAWELSVRAGTERNEDPLAENAKIGYLSHSKDLSRSDLDPFAAKPADMEGFINYGSPIVGEPKQIDLTTKFTEVSQGNNTELGFAWSDINITGTISSGEKIDTHIGNPSEYLFRGANLGADIAEAEAAPLLDDIPSAGRLFKPAPPSLTDLSEELSASQEAFSTFSLNISDASFQLALAAIQKGERPDPDSIKSEQFYNAVDYDDPAPSASEPVAATIDQTAHPVIPGRNLVRVAVRTASAGRSAAQPLRLTLLVDQSGSMVRADRRAAMDTALAQLATLLTENDQVTVIGFSRTPRLLADSLPGNQASKLPDLINQTANEGGTNLEQAINLASELALRHKLDGAQNRIVLFTDGAANLGDADPARLSNKIENLRQQGLAFDIAGIGTTDLNDRLLSDLARHGNGRYYLVGENTANTLAAQLAGAFRPAAENVKIQIKLNPQRVGNYKLIGFEKDRLKTEDFRNDAVDAAELAADEAGVALYQVETLPQGSGEIGEVSIRFRDTGSGEIVERKWTIPYEASAPSFDKANPKTQLATLALLAAQKLQPGPLADAIDFSNYSETIANLKKLNANSTKNQQLLNLINALK